MPQHASEEDLQEAKARYDSGFVCLQHDSLMKAFPHFIQVAGKLEHLPEDMTDEEMLLASRAYYQMAYVFRRKIENNAEIDALRWALAYQRRVQDTTWIVRSSLQLANAFSTLKENDSARYYHDFVIPYLDTISGDLNDYFTAQHVLSDLYYSQHQFDSCFMVQHNTIVFKTRRGMSTANDSVSLGICMYHSPYRLEAKPYLLKVLDMQTGDLERGAIMSLLAQIYEEEGNADSAAFCHGFNKTYVKAESDRVSDGMLAVIQYDNYKAERDARLTALWQEKASQKAKVLRIIYVIVALLLLAALAFVVYHRIYRKKMTQEQEEIKRDLKEAYGALETQSQEAIRLKVQAIYDDKRSNTLGRILKVFNTTYPTALSKLKAAYPDLNETELDICVLSHFPFRMKEIADILDLRENTVSKYRTNIKKKTQTETFEGLWEPFIG
jgi:DNA-binding CsgD family transcriptional regulator